MKNLFILFIYIIILTNCEKWDLDREAFPEIITGEAEIQDSLLAANVFGEIKGLLEHQRIENHGHIWTNQENDLLELPHPNRTILERTGNGTFESELTLASGSTYYYRSYAQFGNQILYGAIKEFNIDSLMIAMAIDSIVVFEKTNTLINKVKIYLTYNKMPIGLIVQDAGIVMSNQPNPNINLHFLEGVGAFLSSDSIVSFTLTPRVDINEDHYFKPYCITNGQIIYGPEILFKIANIWVQREDFAGGGRIRAVQLSIGTKGYTGMGYERKDFWEYDPSADQWTQRADFPGENNYGDVVGFSIGNKGYVLTDRFLKEFWEYNPSLDNWTKKADFPGEDNYSDAVGFSIGNKGYLGTGRTVSDFWEYDPSADQWTQRADFAGGPKGNAVGFSIGNKGYLGTGEDVSNDPTKDFWEYDPNADQWTQRADFAGGPKEKAVGFSIGDKGYIGIGKSNVPTKDFWEYDPESDQWTQRADFGGELRRAAVGFSIGNKGYIGMGQDIFKDFWEYIPE